MQRKPSASAANSRKKPQPAGALLSSSSSTRPARVVATKPRVFGDYCFDFFKACKHNLSAPSLSGTDNDSQSLSSQGNPATTQRVCPLCNLGNQTLQAFFEMEMEQSMQNRAQSIHNRSILRTSLLHQWGCSQSLHYYSLTNMINTGTEQFSPTDFTFDIVWSQTLLDSFLEHNLRGTLDYEDMLRVLQRRNRVYEVGHFAAMLIQRQLRRFLALRRVRKYLLCRFEYTPPTKFKKESYYDSVRLKIVDRYPTLLRRMPHYHGLQHFVAGSLGMENVCDTKSLAGKVTHGEQPASPRTIKRRLTYEDKLAQERIDHFTHSLSKLKESGVFVGQVRLDSVLGGDHLSLASEGSVQHGLLRSFQDISEAIIRQETQNIRHLKQFVLLRDLIHVTMFRLTLTLQKQQQVATMAKKLGTTSKDRNRDREIVLEAEDADANAVGFSPVWVLPNAPGMAPRTLGLTIALLQTPSPTSIAAPVLKTGSVSVTNYMGLNRTASNMTMTTPKAAAVAAAVAIGANNKGGAGNNATAVGPTIYRALQILEQKAFDALKCQTADDVVSMLFLKDLRPIYESIQNITQDDCGIWNSTFSKKTKDSMKSGSRRNSLALSVLSDGFVDDKASLSSAPSMDSFDVDSSLAG
jgi:hypothetical protein